jgi:hypothetical protein
MTPSETASVEGAITQIADVSRNASETKNPIGLLFPFARDRDEQFSGRDNNATSETHQSANVPQVL